MNALMSFYGLPDGLPRRMNDEQLLFVVTLRRIKGTGFASFLSNFVWKLSYGHVVVYIVVWRCADDELPFVWKGEVNHVLPGDCVALHTTMGFDNITLDDLNDAIKLSETHWATWHRCVDPMQLAPLSLRSDLRMLAECYPNYSVLSNNCGHWVVRVLVTLLQHIDHNTTEKLISEKGISLSSLFAKFPGLKDILPILAMPIGDTFVAMPTYETCGSPPEKKRRVA